MNRSVMVNVMIVVLVGAWTLPGSNLSAQQDDDTQLERYEPTLAESQPEKCNFQRYLTEDKFRRPITFYLSKPSRDSADKKLPLVIVVQGSGSQSIFLEIETPDGKLIGSGGPEAVIRRDFKNQVRVLVVEKPGVEFLVQPSRPGGSEEGTEEFNREFSFPRWVEAVCAAAKATLKLDEIDHSKLMVLGHSEGGQVACAVAAEMPEISHVAVMAGGGPSQLFDFLIMAREGQMYDSNATPQERVDQLLADWQKVLDDPTATDKFILGHSHLRWSTFMNSSPVQCVLQSKAKVLIAQGTADTNSLPLSADVLYAELLARGRDCTYLRIEGGNHAFMLEGDKGKGWSETNAKAVRWFLGEDGQ